MGWILANWQNVLSVAAMLSSVVVYTIHKVGHVNHGLLIDDIATHLNDLNNSLNAQDISTPKLPSKVAAAADSSFGSDSMVKNPPA